MKKLFQLLACAILAFVAASCSQGADAIDKAYQQACEAQPTEKIATTLTNGNIDCKSLTIDENAKLGAVLDYIANHGMYSANFEAQVDMYQFGKLLDDYRAVQHSKTGSDRILMDEYVKNIQLGTPAPAAENEK